MTTALSAIEIEVIGSALASICDEMGETLIKTSYSPNIKERRDCTTAVFDADGNTIAQAEHIPIHLGSLIGIVAAVRDQYPVEEIRDGDSFVGNDPHTGGGTHLPDIVLVTPLFVDGRPHGWVTNLAHHADYADRGHAHIYQEGIRIPPVRLVRDGEFVPDVMRLLLANFQVPAERIADFRAQLAANRLGVARFREVYEKYGVETVDAAAAQLLDYTERKTRAGIAEIPDGRYAFTDVLDSAELGEPLDLGVTLTVAGDQLTFDFDAPPQVRASINMVRSALLATVYYVVKCVVGPDIPANAGLYRPITVTAPTGSVLSCVLPAAVNGRTDTCQRVADLALGALAQAVPDKVIAACNGAVTSTTFSGVDPRTGRFYVYLETIGGGLGAGACLDGLDGVQAHITNTSNLPVESLEAEYPLTVERYALVAGSGGVGRQRGGMGIRREIRVEHDACVCGVATSRVTSRPWGLLGGGPGASAGVEINGEPLNRASYTLGRGDVIGVVTAGGGGFGPPSERDPAAVADDVRQGVVSPSVAAEVYGADHA